METKQAENGEMTSIERVQTVIDLKVPDRVPCAPLVTFQTARIANISVYDFIFDFKKSTAASRQVFDKYGGLDIITSIPPLSLFFQQPFPSEHSFLYFDWRFSSDNLPQMIEHQRMTIEDYDNLCEEGFSRFLRFPKGYDLLQIMNDLRQVKKEIRYWRKTRKVDTLCSAGTSIPFDLICLMRGLKDFSLDLHRIPDKILETSLFLAEGLAALAEFLATEIGGKIIFIGGARCSSTFISPKMFEAYVFPALKKMVEILVEDGFIINFHLDTDFTPTLEYFLELPKNGKYILELENTDIYKAKEILGERMCIMGNISSTILRLGTPKKIERIAKDLIEKIGEGGGFILSSGCEVPIDAPFENVKAMIDAVQKYGIYKA